MGVRPPRLMLGVMRTDDQLAKLARWTRAESGSGQDEMLAVPARESPRREVLRGVRGTPRAGMCQLRGAAFPDCQVLLGVRPSDWIDLDRPLGPTFYLARDVHA